MLEENRRGVSGITEEDERTLKALIKVRMLNQCSQCPSVFQWLQKRVSEEC